MKRFLMLSIVLLCLGTGSQALASSFGIFDSSKSLDANLELIYPATGFIDGLDARTLDQGFYFQAIFAADNMISSDSKFFASGNEYSFADLVNSWGTSTTKEIIADMTISYNGTNYSFADLVTSITLYVGDGTTYKPEADLDTMLVDGGSYFVSFSIPGSGNAVDFVLAIASNPIEFRSTPAPAALLLFGTGLAGIFAARRRIKN